MSRQIASLLLPSFSGAIKTEAEEMEENGQFPKAEKEGEIVPKEEAEASEDGMEEAFDDQRTEEDDDEERDGEGDEEEDSLNEPQDLSVVDYTRYDSAALPDAHAGAVACAEGTYVSGALAPRIQASGKLNCDICGLSCVSINVLLVHKRSHTGKHRNTTQTPDLKHNSCAIIPLLIARGDSALHWLGRSSNYDYMHTRLHHTWRTCPNQCDSNSKRLWNVLYCWLNIKLTQ